MDQRQISLTAGEFSYLEAGVGGAPLLLVHGFTGSKEDFGEELDRFAAAGFHAVSPELRGHGDSVHLGDEAAYGLELFAGDLWELVEHLGWDRFDLLGHSMGGMIVQVMALQAPERIGRFILMDTHHGTLQNLDPGLVEIGLEIIRTQGLGVLQEVLKLGADPLANPAFERTCAERPGYREWSDSKMLRVDPAMYASMGQQFQAIPDRLDRLATLEMPTLVLVGELDAPFLDASRAMAQAIPNATLAVIPDGGHCPQFEATAAWRAAVDQFLEIA